MLEELLTNSSGTAAQIVPAIAPEVAEVNQIIRNQHYIQRPAPIKYNHITNWIFSNIPGMMELHRLIIFLGAEVAAPLQYTNIFAERFRKVMQKKVIRYMKAKAPKEYHNILIPDFQYFCKVRINLCIVT